VLGAASPQANHRIAPATRALEAVILDARDATFDDASPSLRRPSVRHRFSIATPSIDESVVDEHSLDRWRSASIANVALVAGRTVRWWPEIDRDRLST
jgi:hypothetical protein